MTEFFERPFTDFTSHGSFYDTMSEENVKSKKKNSLVARPATVDPADPSRAKVFLFGLDENEVRFVFLRSCKDSRVLKSM